MSLTASAVEKLKAGASRREVPDDRPRGLYLVIQPAPGGAKAWAVRARLHGKSIKITLGSWPAWGLKEARVEASRILQAVNRGEDPRAEKREKEEAARREASDTLEAVFEDWMSRDQGKNKSAFEVRRAMVKDVVPAWRGRPLAEIGRRDIVELLDAVVDRGAPVHARRLHAYVRRMFAWAVLRGIIETNPAASVAKPHKETARDRVLADDELARIWHACGRLGYPFGPAIRSLILTGARRAEIGDLLWSEIADGEIRLDAGRTKTGEPRAIPLAPQAAAILEGLPRIARGAGAPDFVFTVTGKTPVSGWSKAKLTLDALAAGIDAAGRKLDTPAPLAPWRLHDLRRTCATGLQRLGHRLEVIEAVLGHVGGSRSGIVGVYQRHAFGPEKRLALEDWSRHVDGLVAGKLAGGNVVAMTGRGAA